MTIWKLSVAAAAVMAAGGFAYAQDNTQQQPVEQSAGCPAPGTVPEAELPANCKPGAANTGGATTDSTTGGATTDTTTGGAVTDTTKQVNTGTTDGAKTGMTELTTINSADAFLASRFIGQTVYTTADENIGDINDIIVAKEKGAVYAVIGVGGFLGIGEKDVAVPMEQVQITKDANNNMKLNVNLSRQQLEASPAFDRTATVGG